MKKKRNWRKMGETEDKVRVEALQTFQFEDALIKAHSIEEAQRIYKNKR